MQATFVALAVVASLAGLLVALPPKLVGASTCSMLEIPDPKERLDVRLEYRPELVVVGVVIREIPTEMTLFRPGSDVPSLRIEPLDSAPTDPESLFNIPHQSTMHVEAVLKGDTSPGNLVLSSLTDGWDCVGGPRLHEGDRVLLILSQEPTWTSFGEWRDVIWTTGPTGGNIILRDEGAVLDDYQASLGSDLGPSADLVNYVADKVDAPGASRAAALAALGSPVEEQQPGPDMLLALAVIGGLSLVVGLAFVALQRRRA